jgi:hypothetical protein
VQTWSPGWVTVAALAGCGVYVAHVPLATLIGSGGPETHPDTIAGLYWDLQVSRDPTERLYSHPVSGGEAVVELGILSLGDLQHDQCTGRWTGWPRSWATPCWPTSWAWARCGYLGRAQLARPR